MHRAEGSLATEKLGCHAHLSSSASCLRDTAPQCGHGSSPFPFPTPVVGCVTSAEWLWVGGQGCARVAVWVLTQFHFELDSCRAWRCSKQVIMYCICISHGWGSTCVLVVTDLRTHLPVCEYLRIPKPWIDLNIVPLLISSVFRVPLMVNADCQFDHVGDKTLGESPWVCCWWILYIRLIEVARPPLTVTAPFSAWGPGLNKGKKVGWTLAFISLCVWLQVAQVTSYLSFVLPWWIVPWNWKPKQTLSFLICLYFS